MSNEFVKEKHSKRLHDDETHIKKRQRVLKDTRAYFSEHIIEKQPHRLHKCSGMNCGNSKCVMCGNPRKMFKELTIQEKKFYQDKLYNEEDISERDV